MKFLFMTIRSPATVYAAAPLATAARNAGHEVLLAANEPLMDTAEAIGVPAVSIMPEPLRHFMTTDPVKNRRIGVRDPKEEMLGFGRGFGQVASAGLGALLDLARDWRPDLVIGGSMSYAAGLLAASLPVPYVRHAEYLAIPVTGIDPVAEEELRPELNRLGLAGLPDPALFVDVTPPSLRPPTPGTQPMRWIPTNRQRRLEPWMYTRPKGRPRVLITSGMRTPDWSMPALLDRLARTGAEVLIAAHEDAVERYGARLGDVRVGWIPVDVVAPTCDLAVHHGGGITATTLMAAGVPQLIIPENPHNVPDSYYRGTIARVLSGFGAGLTIVPNGHGPDQDPAGVIAEGCREVLANPRYARQARALAAEIATLPTPAEVVGMLETLAAS
jgi:UDP:flavonoid glycosyltransferase YjiC (YdhE family)